MTSWLGAVSVPGNNNTNEGPMRFLAIIVFLLVWCATHAVAGDRPTKDAEGFTSEWDNGPGAAISRVRLGEQAIYWMGLTGLEADRPYHTQCTVVNSDDKVVHQEDWNEPPKRSRAALFCGYMP